MTNYQELFSDLAKSLRQFEARVDARFASVDARFGQVEARLNALDQKVDGVRRDMGVQFRWMTSIMVTGIIAVVTTILAQ